MSKFFTYLLFTLVSLGVLFFVCAPFLAKKSLFFSTKTSVEQFASVFFSESSNPEVLKNVFASAVVNGRKLRILVVPGHDSEYWGTQFKNTKESDLTLFLGKELFDFLFQDDKFDVQITRDDKGYLPLFEKYFLENKDDINNFSSNKKRIMDKLVSSGDVLKYDDGVFHNNAPSVMATRLYGINKWANENNIDLVIHIHFNDYPRRNKSLAGDYSGFSIYVPEKQYSNARASREVADSVAKQLITYYPESNLPKEDSVVVEDQDLIAIGAFNTLDPASLLIEYGYIYEPQFSDNIIREKVLRELAFQTFLGIKNFFGDTGIFVNRYGTTLLPYRWNLLVDPGTKYDLSILSLQLALTLDGVYPPKNFERRDCPVSGTYGRCTRASVAAFQHKHGILGTPGVLNSLTLEKLNQLYGE